MRACLTGTEEALLLSPFVLAEADHLARRGGGPDAALALLDAVQRGRFILERIEPDHVARCRAIVAQYRDLGIGVTDASIVCTSPKATAPNASSPSTSATSEPSARSPAGPS